MSQSRAYSLIEAVANVVVGYGLAVATQIVIFPVFGLRTSLRDDLTIGAVFSGVSLVRSYALRRLFERFRARPADLPPAPVAPTSGVERVDPSTAVDLLAADSNASLSKAHARLLLVCSALARERAVKRQSNEVRSILYQHSACTLLNL